MQIIKEFFKQKRFKNWDEAFRALTPVMRQQSVRVADYTQVLFEGACKSSVYLKDHESPVYLDLPTQRWHISADFIFRLGKHLNRKVIRHGVITLQMKRRAVTVNMW